MKDEISTSLECSHCHQPIIEAIEGENSAKVYCCYGCKVVDELLTEKKSIIEPGSTILKKYAYLDEPRIRTSLLNFEEDNFARASIHLPAIHCSSCIYLLESLPEVEEGILEVKVQFARKQADISFRSDKIRFSQVAALLDYIGYPPDFQTKLSTQKKKRNILLIQLGVAGFFFGNTMLLALPDYLDSSLAADADIQQFFRYLMMLFSLPVVIFSGRDYFINSIKSLRAGILSIDLPIALGITAIFLRSAFEVFSGIGPGYFDSLTGLIFFLLIGKWYQQKTYENFTFDRDLRSFLPLAANLISGDGHEKPVALDDLKEGDIILVRQGEVLPADARLLSDTSLVDYSYITGEAIPVEKKHGESVYAGARIKGAAVRFEITSTADHSYLSSIWARDSFKNHSHKAGKSFTDRISQRFTPAIILIALVAAIAWSFYDTSKAVTVFTAVLIVACPCALALAEPFATGSMMRIFGKNGFFLKSAQVLTRLQEITHLVFDKTGTLTRQDAIRVNWHGDELSFDETLAIASIAKNAQHPLARPLSDFLKVNDLDAQKALHFTEASGEGVSANISRDQYRLGKAAFIGLEDRANTTSVYVEKNGKVLGYFSFYQQTRQATTRVVHSLQEQYPVSLLSGDNEGEKNRFTKIFGPGADLQFNQSPHQKLEYLLTLQRQNKKVLMLGDGLNDAGALQQSEVGISLCEKNVNFFPASDALLQADSFNKLDKFLALAHINKKVVRQAFRVSLAYNIAGLSFAVAGVLSPLVCAILMPISSVTVVIFTTLTNRWWATKIFTPSSKPTIHD